MSNNPSYLETLKEQLQEIQQAIEETHKIAQDPELQELAEKELEKLRRQKVSLQTALESIEQSGNTKNTNHPTTRDVIVEIRAAAGGNEAGLFASDLYRMYLKFAEKQGWKTKQLSINEGGIGNIKEVTFEISASQASDSPYSLLQYESGVHRVQRIPVTESSGRIHTSTATVAVLPKVKNQEVKLNPSDLEFETFRASGPGGQHVNKTESAIRVTHKPTGLVISCQESRSQLKNRETALSILRARLYQKQEDEKRERLGAKRREQIGAGDRAEKIRTYNFPQDRVTDHRLGKSWYKIADIMDGKLLPILREFRDQKES